MRISETATECVRMIDNFCISNVEGERGLEWPEKDKIFIFCICSWNPKKFDNKHFFSTSPPWKAIFSEFVRKRSSFS